jgi:hypothetical protein
MPTLQDQIHYEHKRLAARPLPARWIRQHAELARYADHASLVAVLRDRSRVIDGDRIVQALTQLAHDDPNATNTLLEGLSWWLRGGIYRRLSVGYRDEILIELSVVILEASGLEHLDKLQARLLRRAHARAGRRHQTAYRGRRREVSLTEDVLDPPTTVDVAAIAVDRVQLASIVETIHEHIDAGRLSRRSWEDCRDGVLAPALGLTRLQDDRCRTSAGVALL